MRLDHIAIRCLDRKKVAMFYIDAFGYRYAEKFRIPLGDETDLYSDYADCVVLTPPEKINQNMDLIVNLDTIFFDGQPRLTYHIAPEIFISDGPPSGLIDRWATERQTCGHNLIHHLAYQVDDVQKTMDLWLSKKWAEFTTNKPIVCPQDGLVQVFTKSHPLTGFTYEFIQRPADGQGFCRDSVRQIMIASDIKV